MSNLTPIETTYKGIRFRSRLEARYAVFFDRLGIRWEYEPQGFKLPSGECYLPDFWLPEFDGGTYVEVKPFGGDFAKARELSAASKRRVWLCEGTPKAQWYRVAGGPSGCEELAIPAQEKRSGFWWSFGQHESTTNDDLERDDSYGIASAARAAQTERFGT